MRAPSLGCNTHHTRKAIARVLSRLSEHRLRARIHITGSLARGATTPRDVDAVIDLRDLGANARDLEELRDLLVLARRRATGIEGAFDPFVLFAERMYGRDDEAKSWIRVDDATLRDSLIAGMVPIEDIVGTTGTATEGDGGESRDTPDTGSARSAAARWR